MIEKRIKKTLIFLLLSFILLGCANQLPPTGGEADKTPPEIINIYPPNGTVNFDEDYFEIEFSEYVDKRSVKDAIFISPIVEETLQYDWSGTSVQVNFPGGFKKDFTYTITIGTDVVDLNNRNRMSSAFTFSFSTGDKIDKKTIAGKVYGKDFEGVLIFAYKLSGAPDTLLLRKPDYVSQTGTDGSFLLSGLADNNYRVFAVDDKFRDLLFQPEQDLIGVPFTDINLSDSDSTFENLYFQLFNADTSKPRLISSIMTDEKHILLSFSKEFDKLVIKQNNFSVYDSTENKSYNILYAFKGLTKPEELVLVPESKLPLENKLYVFADSIKDLTGNITLNDLVKLTASDKPDTTALNVASTKPSQNGEIDFEDAVIEIYFDDAFSKDDIKKAIAFTDTLKNKIPFSLNFKDDAAIEITPVQELKSEKQYLVKIDLNYFKDASGNSTDSVFTLQFSTISGLDFTGISGNVKNLQPEKHPVLILENTEEEKYKYEIELTGSNYEFKRIEPGKYLLWCFYDENENKLFDYGWPHPIKYSERFSFYPDTLNLRARWQVTDILFRFK